MTSRIDGESSRLQKLENVAASQVELVDSDFGEEASQRLFDEMDYQRATQAYVWSTPLVSTTTWRDELTDVFDVQNWSDFVVLQTLKERTGIVTGNLTTPYIGPGIDLRVGAPRALRPSP